MTGKIKLIAGTTEERLPDMPGKPTIADTYPGFNVVAFQALVGPTGIPEPILKKLSSDIASIIDSKEFADKTKHLGINSWGTTPQELEAWMRKEIANWKTIADKANIKVE